MSTLDLILTSVCKDCVENMKLQYQWVISIYNSGWKIIDLPLSFTSTGSRMETLVVRKGFFQCEFYYRIYLHAWMAGGRKSVNFIQMEINSSPENGTCLITPLIGEAMMTSFAIKCSGWSDKNLPLFYRFLYEKDDVVNILYEGPREECLSLLPIGDMSLNYSLKVIVEVKDSIESVTKWPLTVMVSGIYNLIHISYSCSSFGIEF